MSHISNDGPTTKAEDIYPPLSSIIPVLPHVSSMGAALSHSFCRGKEINVVVLGLGMGGKTTFMYKLQTDEIVTTVPTIGFNVETICYKNRYFLMWDYGGTNKFRPEWKTIFAPAEALIFVVDSTDPERFCDAGNELKYLLDQINSTDTLRHVPLLLFANKQDEQAAKAPVDVLVGMKIDDFLEGRRWHVVGSSFTEGMGMDEGMDWLLRALSPA